MKMADVKTILTSGTLLFAVVLYLIFNNTGQEKAQTGEYKITPEIAIETTGNELQQVEYVSTNDGDTFRVKMDGQEQRIRLLMIDTPEMNYEENDPMPFAEEARDFTTDLLENASKIELLFDVGPEADHYDRLLAYVFVDGVLLQERLLSEGYAAVRFINEPNNSLEEEFRDIEEVAKQAKLRIWETDEYIQKDGFHPEVIEK